MKKSVKLSLISLLGVAAIGGGSQLFTSGNPVNPETPPASAESMARSTDATQASMSQEQSPMGETASGAYHPPAAGSDPAGAENPMNNGDLLGALRALSPTQISERVSILEQIRANPDLAPSAKKQAALSQLNSLGSIPENNSPDTTVILAKEATELYLSQSLNPTDSVEDLSNAIASVQNPEIRKMIASVFELSHPSNAQELLRAVESRGATIPDRSPASAPDETTPMYSPDEQ